MQGKRELIITSAIIIAIFSLVPHHVYGVSGTSMNPTLKAGDLVVIGKEINGNLTNEIVVFEDPIYGLIVHRVIADNSEMVMTKGDANNGPDGWITKENIIGVVIFVIPSEAMILPPIAFIILCLVGIYKVHQQS